MTTFADEDAATARAGRLIEEGIVGNRGQIASMIYEAVLEEREACAKIAAFHKGSPIDKLKYGVSAGTEIAAKIRNRNSNT
ncbi:MAG: hypothetical protein ABL931_13735 [Usitatibacteraceae bacterium]